MSAKPVSKTHRTAKVFKRNYRKWVDVVPHLVKAGGLLAWRTEVSRCRTQLGMAIEWNKDVKRSAYRYVGKYA